MSTTVIRAAETNGLGELREALLSAFERAQQAMAAGDSLVIVVPAEDVLGHRGGERGALVGALTGIVRALAFEGARAGWQANALAVPGGTEVSDERAADHFPPGVSGQVVTIGTSLVGKVAP